MLLRICPAPSYIPANEGISIDVRLDVKVILAVCLKYISKNSDLELYAYVLNLIKSSSFFIRYGSASVPFPSNSLSNKSFSVV